MVSPPKPWERAGSVAAGSSSSVPLTPQAAVAAASAPAPIATATATAAPTPSAASSSSSSAPAVPTRPASFTNQTALASQTNAYSSPYNRLGGVGYSPYQSSMYGGMGMGMGYGSYGGYGMGNMYPGSYGMGMNSMGMYGATPFGPNNPSMTQTLETTTQHTFALLQSIVQTFTGLAQMLESTFMATHSSFFALAGVVDQFSQLRNALGGVLGLFGLVRWLKDVLTGRSTPAGALRGEFGDFLAGRPVQAPAPPPGASAPRPNRKPLIIFFLAIFGIPYAMHRLIKILAERANAIPQALPPLDPSQLTFARAKFAFAASSPAELSLSENEIVAVMGKLDPATGAEIDPRMELETEWWKGRTREGREGWFPRGFVEVLERKVKGVEPTPAPAQGEAKKVE